MKKAFKFKIYFFKVFCLFCSNLICTFDRQFNVIFYMQETTYRCSAYRTLIRLHSDNLAAVNAQTHMSTWQNHSILGCSIAYHTFLLTFISQISCIIIDSIYVVQVHYLIIIKQLLSDILVSHI